MHKSGLAPPLVTAGHLGFSLHIIFVHKRCLRVTFPKSLRNLPTFSRIVNAKQIWIASRSISHQSQRCACLLSGFQGQAEPDILDCHFCCGKGRVVVQCEHKTPTSSWRSHIFTSILSPVRLFSAKKDNK